MSNDSSAGPEKQRGPNFEKNLRPKSSKRVTFALGLKGQEQADRLARILSSYRKGGVSQSALVRILLQIAETAALQSDDPVARLVFGRSEEIKLQPAKTKASENFSRQIWDMIRTECSKV